MNIFESLENLNVSEECFDSILDIVEELLLEFDEAKKVAVIKKRIDNFVAATKAAKESSQAYPKGNDASVNDKLASLRKTANLKNAQDEAARKLNRVGDLARTNIKDPANRKELRDYALKNM